MKTFYRTTIALCIFLIIVILTSGTCAATDLIEIRGPTPVANFHYTIKDNVVSFYDMSKAATLVEWDFGDGTKGYSYPVNTGGIEEIVVSITHTYSNPETYEVKSTAYNQYGNNSVVKSISYNYVEISSTDGIKYLIIETDPIIETDLIEADPIETDETEIAFE